MDDRTIRPDGVAARRLRKRAPQQSSLSKIVFLYSPFGIIAWGVVSACMLPRRVNIPPRSTPKTLVVDGHTGLTAPLVNGEYVLQLSLVNGRPTWAKRQHFGAGALAATISYSPCGEWLITGPLVGRGENCTGWVRASGCGDGTNSGPWDCTGQWRKWSREGPLSESLAVTLEQGPPALAKCSKDEEQALYAAAGGMDVVLLWINGSDPTWLHRRDRACKDYFGQLWDDAVYWSLQTRACLEDASENGTSSNRCGPAGECAEASDGLRSLSGARVGDCFQQYLHVQCGSRLHSIRDHDELRYLVRSVERHLRWHTGRILLVLPKGQRPSWLQARGRLQLVFQEDLLRTALESPAFAASQRRASHAPDRTFNDEAILAALPFLPGASRFILVLQDDLFLPRPVSACELFTRPPRAGVRLFGRSRDASDVPDPYASVYRASEAWTDRLWDSYVRSREGAAAAGSPYYQSQHAPWILDTAVLHDLWRRWPRAMSAALDSPFRHPNLTDVIGLHHSEMILRGREARAKCARDSWLCWLRALVRQRSLIEEEVPSRSRVEDVDRQGQTAVREAVLRAGTAEEWNYTMQLFQAAGVVPSVYSLQDDYQGPVSQEQACLRERWLNKFVPHRSSWESPTSPPSGCRG